MLHSKSQRRLPLLLSQWLAGRLGAQPEGAGVVLGGGGGGGVGLKVQEVLMIRGLIHLHFIQQYRNGKAQFGRKMVQTA